MSSADTRRPYTRFIVLSIPRSGTNLLWSLLNSHPDIRMHNEIFNANLVERKTAWQHTPNYHLGEHEDPLVYLQEHVFPPEAPCKAVGFKVFPEQLERTAKLQTVETYLEQDTDIRVICLERENLIDGAVSRIIAHDTKRFATTEQYDGTSVAIPFDRIERFMLRRIGHVSRARSMFPHHKKLSVTYEHLMSRPDDTFSQILLFLGLPLVPLRRTFKLERQRMVPKRTYIKNYDELRRHISLAHPQWLKWMDDDPDHLPTLTEVLTPAA